MGGTKKRGEKKLVLDEFLPIYGQVRMNYNLLFMIMFINVIRITSITCRLRKKRNKDAMKISLSVLNYTTKTKTVQCFSLN